MAGEWLPRAIVRAFISYQKWKLDMGILLWKRLHFENEIVCDLLLCIEDGTILQSSLLDSW